MVLVAKFLDDANVPSLLSLPWLGFVPPNDPIYAHTRTHVANRSNPWYAVSDSAEGVGSPHTGARTIWPMGIIMRALTSTDDAETRRALKVLVESAAASGLWLMTESFQADDARKVTRPWFAWCNSLFGELVVGLAAQRPHLLGLDS